MGSSHGLIFLLVYCLHLTEGEIRCYCNEARCVRTGYMCKSTLNACYSILTYDDGKPKTTQGCIESLEPSKRVVCKSEKPEQYTSKLPTQEQSLLICCHNDMCNYNEKTISIIVKEKSNGSTQNGNENLLEDVPSFHKDPKDSSVDKDLWFKAAVIAVPIAGGFILILLVLLAVRMLRTDSRRHRQLIQIRRERTSLTKAQLYVTDHFCDKPCNKKAPLLYDDKQNIVCKEPFIKVDKDGKIYEQVGDTSKCKNKSPSLIVWGKPGKTDIATVV